MNKSVKSIVHACAVGALSLVVWVGIFMTFDFATTTYASPKEIQKSLEKAPRGPISEQEFDRRTEEARKLIREQIVRDKQRVKVDPFVYVREKSIIWTWIPWFLCVLLFGVRNVIGYFVVLSFIVVIFALRLVSIEATIVVAFSIFAAQGIRMLATDFIRAKWAR